MLALGPSILSAFLLVSEPASAPDGAGGTPRTPSPSDTDRDGVSNAVETAQGTDPAVPGLFPGAYPHIPEPLVFDLVRGLGARKGEFEVNTLAVARMRPYRGLAWAPEIEWAFADRHALEFELPMHDAKIEALKLAVQGTVRERRPKFIHGWQLIGEYLLEERALELTALYLAGRRVGRRVSLFAMLGPRAATDGTSLHAELVVNPSLFVDLGERVTIGLENIASIDGAASRVGLVPQVHLQLGRHFRLQLGGGVELSRDAVTPLAAIRAVVE